MTKKNVKFFCILSICIFFIFQLKEFELWNSISYAASLSALLAFLYEKFLWRINFLEKTPRIFGTYSVSAESNYNSGHSYETTITIKQTLSSITVTEEFEEGFCESIVATLSKNTTNGPWFLFYTYLTHPNIVTTSNKQDDMHYGTAILYVKNRNQLDGKYYTNRVNQTAGNMKLVRKRRNRK